MDNVIAAMEARHPHLTTQMSFYVEGNRARAPAELVTDDTTDLPAQLQAVTGERIAALEGIGEMPRREPGDGTLSGERQPDGGAGSGKVKEPGGLASPSKDREPVVPKRDKVAGMDLGL